MYKTKTRIANEYAETARRARAAAESIGHEPKRFVKVSDGHFRANCHQCLLSVDLHLTPDQVWQTSGGMTVARCRI